MTKLQEMVAFGDAADALPCDRRTRALRMLRASLRWVLALSLLGAAFSGVMTYREYTTSELVCAPLGPAESALGLPPCVYGLALWAMLAAIAAVALARTRGEVGDEIVASSL